MKYLNVKIAYKGVKYLIEAIYLLYHFEEYYDCNLEKDIYPLIAKKYCKKASNIKSNINYAVNTLYAECEEEKLLNYLNEYSVYKPSPKRIILSILDNIKNVNIHS
ncbi:MAG: sporulation initiation factor Spo0A C-terminal domain-containing protein [Clostridia bacterium]